MKGQARSLVTVLLAALLAAGLGLVASIAVYGPGPLLRSPLGQAFLSHWMSAQAPPGVTVVVPGQAVPAFRLAGLDGPAQPLPMAGRWQLINYWASWCGPCREEMPLLSAYAQAQPADGVAVVGVALDAPADARAFLAEVPVSFPVLLEAPGPGDSSVRLGNGLGVLPYSVLIDPDGRLRARRFGNFRDARDLQDWIAGNR